MKSLLHMFLMIERHQSMRSLRFVLFPLFSLEVQKMFRTDLALLYVTSLYVCVQMPDSKHVCGPGMGHRFQSKDMDARAHPSPSVTPCIAL